MTSPWSKAALVWLALTLGYVNRGYADPGVGHSPNVRKSGIRPVFDPTSLNYSSDRRKLGRLMHLWKTVPVRYRRGNLATALGIARDPRALACLLPFLKGKDPIKHHPEVDNASLSAGRTGDLRAVPFLVYRVMFVMGIWRNTREAAHLLKEMGWRVVPPTVRELRRYTGTLATYEGSNPYTFKDVFAHPRFRTAVDWLARALRSKDFDERAAAAFVLSWIEGARVDVLLNKAAQDSDLRVRAVVRNAMKLRRATKRKPSSSRSGPKRAHISRAQLLRLLEDPGDETRATALDRLAALDGRRATNRLIKALKDHSDKVQEVAVKHLGRLKVRSAVPVLIQMLKQKELVEAAVEALGSIGDHRAFEPLVKVFKSSDYLTGAEALARLGDRRAVPVLIESLAEYDAESRSANASLPEALVLMGKQAVPSLVKALGHKNSRVRGGVVEVLGKLKPQSAVPGLINALKDRAALVREGAAYVLGEIRARQAVNALLPLLNHQDADMRQAVAFALGRIGSTSAVNGLEKSLADHDTKVAWSAAEALRRLGSAGTNALIRSLSHQDPFVRRTAAEFLGRRYAPEDERPLNPIPPLRERLLPLSSIRFFKKPYRRAIPHLIKALKDPVWYVRQWAVWSLASIGGRNVVVHIKRMLTDPNGSVRNEAKGALAVRFGVF